MFYERMRMIWLKCVTLELEGARQRGRPKKTWKEVIDKDMNDLHAKPSDGYYGSK